MKKIATFLLMVVAMFGVVMAPATNTFADDGNPCEKRFMGMRPWYQGLTSQVKASDGSMSCVIKDPGDNLASFVWTIVLNISADLSMMIGYASLIFIIYGGFRYMMSNGDSGQVASAKKTIVNAVIGLIIGVLATVIVNTILVVLGNAAS